MRWNAFAAAVGLVVAGCGIGGRSDRHVLVCVQPPADSVVRPGTSKPEVIRRGVALGIPFELTLSCMKPVKVSELREPSERREPRHIHCGTCSKCRERHDAFVALGMMDPTSYADERFVRG